MTGAQDDPHGADPQAPFLEEELQDDDAAATPARRRLPGWLLPAAAAGVGGVLVGALLFGGDGDGPVTAAAPASSAPATGPVPAAGSGALTRAEPVAIDIPAIEVQSSLVDLGLNPDRTLEVPTDFAKAGWFTGGNLPGDPSGPPALIAGHVDDYTGPAVFYRLGDLTTGDEVMVTRADNTVAVSTVTGSEQYPKDAFPADQVYAPVDDSELVLITCTGSFDESVRSYRDNLVVRAVLDVDRSTEESAARASTGAAAPAGDLPNV